MEVNYKELYYRLFAVLADCTAALEAQNYGLAKDILIQAQQDAEEQFLNAVP